MSAQRSGGRGLVIAIDGPSGAGKSSTSRGVARARGARYLDTGAMYRAMTWWMLHHGVDTADPSAVAKHVADPVLMVGTDPERPGIEADGMDLAAQIREDRVTRQVSAVAAVAEVRERMVADQRAIIAAARLEPAGIVVEGRDITTVVAPDAEVKIFLTASAQARAERRSAELARQDLAATREDLARRDRIDSGRAVAPLRRTAEAVELDSSGMTLEEVVAAVGGLAEEAAQREA